MSLESLKSVVRSVEYTDASYVQYAIATSTLFFTRVFIPHKPQSKLKPGMEPTKKKAIRVSKSAPDKENLERSARRAKQKVRDICFSNTFELFATFTFAKDRENDNVLNQRMIDWLKNQKSRWGNFEYIIVKERQKDGTLHFHALIKGFKGKLNKAINPKTGKSIQQKGRTVHNFTGYKSGFSTCVKIDEGVQSQERTISYLAKYLNKDSSTYNGKKRYWVSRGLKRPIVEINPNDWYEKLSPIFSHSNEFGKTLYFKTFDVSKAKS